MIDLSRVTPGLLLALSALGLPALAQAQPLHPNADSQDPSAFTVHNVGWNYAMGYHFTPQVDGQVTELGGQFNGTKTVRLFEKASGILLAETQVTASNAWAYQPLAQPVAVAAGTTYTVAVYLGGSGGCYRSLGTGNTYPVTAGDVVIESGTYVYTGSNPGARPTYDYTYSYQLGQADIGFASAPPPPPPPPPSSLAFSDGGQAFPGAGRPSLLDLDGDGDLDVVAFEPFVGFTVHRNNGQAGFSLIGTYSDGSWRSLPSGDVDGDGDLDLVGSVLWLNNGFGGFTAQSYPGAYASSTHKVLGDVDGDGDLDMVGQRYLRRNDGQGNFFVSGSIPSAVDPVSGTGFDSQDLALGDVDGDGDLDLVMAYSHQLGNANRVLLNSGTGSFSDSGARLGDKGTRDVELVDIDGDGDLDMMCGNAAAVGSSPEANELWLNDGAGGFQLGQSLGLARTYALALADFDCDGDVDVAAGNLNSPSRIYLNDAGQLSDAGIDLQEIGGVFGAAAGDLDGDASADLILVDGNGAILLNDVDCGCVPKAQLAFTQGVQPYAVAAKPHLIDLDGDGDRDLVAFEPFSGFEVFLGDGQGGFASVGLYSDTAWHDLALGDVDGDGDVDLVGKVLWINDGSGGFSSQSYPGAYTASRKVLGDVDGDGDLDMVGHRYMRRNDGQGNFSVAGSIPVAQNPATGSYFDSSDHVLGDVDGDGDLDVVMAYSHSVNGNRILLNNGTGSFSDSGVLLGDSKTYAIELADLDADGDLDMVAGNGGISAQPNRVWLNDGAGGFSPAASLGAGKTYGLAVADLDCDGDLDLLAGNYGGPSRVWRNEGGATFTDTGLSLPATATTRTGVAAGDLNGDVYPDLVIANNSGGTVWIND